MNMGPELGNSPLGGWPELVNASHDLKSQGAFSQLIVDGATLQRQAGKQAAMHPGLRQEQSSLADWHTVSSSADVPRTCRLSESQPCLSQDCVDWSSWKEWPDRFVGAEVQRWQVEG